MWIVWSYDEGLICEIDDRNKALKCYEDAKKGYVDGFDGEFYGNEKVFLAKVEKDFYSYDTGEVVFEEDEEGIELSTKDTYWDWKENDYS